MKNQTPSHIFQTSLMILSIIMGLASFSPLKADDVIARDQSSLEIDTILHFGSGYSTDFPAPSGSNAAVNLNNKSNGLSILSASLKNLGQEMDQYSNDSKTAANGTGAPRVTTQALVYPNPFRQQDGAKLGYGLSGDISEIEIQFYDMTANLIAKKTFKDQGARQGYNLIDINLQTFDGYYLSAGVYFYLILCEGKVLAKGKVAVIP